VQVKRKTLCSWAPFSLVQPEILPGDLTRPGGPEILQSIKELTAQVSSSCVPLLLPGQARDTLWRPHPSWRSPASSEHQRALSSCVPLLLRGPSGDTPWGPHLSWQFQAPSEHQGAHCSGKQLLCTPSFYFVITEIFPGYLTLPGGSDLLQSIKELTDQVSSSRAAYLFQPERLPGSYV
jgi:hypothetical protein